MGSGVSVVIQATDHATKTITGINKSLRGIAAPGERFVKAVGKLSDTTGLTAAARGVGRLTSSVMSGVASLGRFAPALGALTGAASVAGIAGLTEKWTGFGSRLGLESKRIGIASERLHGLQGAARLAGASAEDLTGGMQTLGDGLVDAVGGRNGELVQLMSNMHIAFKDAATGGARLAEDVLPEVADRIAAIKNPSLQAMVATKFFGGAAEALLPFLRRGAAGIADYNEQAKRYGLVNQAGVDAANDLRQAQTRLGLAVEGVAYTVAERLAPVLVPMLTQLSDWIAANRDGIGDFFKGIASDLKEWIDNDGPKHVKEWLVWFGTEIGRIAVTVGRLFGLQPPPWMARMLGLAVVETNDDFMKKLASGNPGDASGNPGDVGSGNPGDGGGFAASFWGTLFGNGSLDRPTLPAGTGPQADTRTWWQRNAPAALGGRPAPAGANPAPTITPGSTALPAGPSKADFVAKYGGAAQTMAQETGTSAKFWLAQWGQETGWGRTVVGNNLGNIQANEGYQGATVMRTDHDAQGNPYQHAFRSYATPEEAARDEAALIRRKYPGALNKGDDIMGAGQGLKAGGYAEDPDYAQHVVMAANVLGPVAPAPPAQAPAAAPPPPMAPAQPLPSLLPSGQPGANGTVTSRIEFANAPDGMRTTTQTSGDVQFGGVRVSRPALGLGNLP